MEMGEIRLELCCRLCLKEGFSLTNIFSHRSAAGDPLYRILNFIYEMKIFENDGLPSQICTPCLWRMIEFDACKRNVRSAEAEIIRLLHQTRPRPDEAHNNILVMKSEDTGIDGASVVGTECDTVHSEHLEEAYNDSLLTMAEVTEMDEASEVGINCDTVHSEGLIIPKNESSIQFTDPRQVSKEIKYTCILFIAINIKEEIEIVEWQMPEEMKKEEMDIEILRGKDLELKESELFIDKVDAIQPSGSLDIKNFIDLEVSEESVKNSFEGESIFSTQGISDKNRDKGMSENDLRGDVAPEEESAELSKSILDVTTSEVSHLNAPLSKRKRMFICDVCKKCFKWKCSLGNHVRVHYDDRPFSCNICDKRFKQDAGRYLHELRHLRDNMSFGNSEIGSKKNQYNCGICAKNFSTEKGLHWHSNLHNNKFKCKSCGKCFHNNANLRRHFRIHTKEKPFECKVCSKCFNDKGNLNSHSRIHSSEKPFSCEICDKKFKRKCEKEQHELQHLRKK